MKRVAVLIDGAFLSNVFHGKTNNHLYAENVLKLAKKVISNQEELFRIYYYDAPPFDRELINPISKTKEDYSKTPPYRAITMFHKKLAEEKFVALRKGYIRFSGWKITDDAIGKIERGGVAKALQGTDIQPVFKQKAVDMKIGLDIAWLATKRIVDKVILVTADNDFIPAMKFARKEGLHVAIAKIKNLNSAMKQHSDEIIDVDISKI